MGTFYLFIAGPYTIQNLRVVLVVSISICKPPSSLLIGKNTSFIAPPAIELFSLVVVLVSKTPSSVLSRSNKFFVVFESVKVFVVVVVFKPPSPLFTGKNLYSVNVTFVVGSFVVVGAVFVDLFVVVENEEPFFSQ